MWPKPTRRRAAGGCLPEVVVDGSQEMHRLCIARDLSGSPLRSGESGSRRQVLPRGERRTSVDRLDDRKTRARTCHATTSQISSLEKNSPFGHHLRLFPAVGGGHVDHCIRHGAPRVSRVLCTREARRNASRL